MKKIIIILMMLVGLMGCDNGNTNAESVGTKDSDKVVKRRAYYTNWQADIISYQRTGYEAIYINLVQIQEMVSKGDSCLIKYLGSQDYTMYTISCEEILD